MGKAIQLAHNGRKPPDSEAKNTGLSFDLFQELDNHGSRAGIPAMEGPHASRPWVGVLRSMTQAGYRVK
jgi:hypothetical protein